MKDSLADLIKVAWGIGRTGRLLFRIHSSKVWQGQFRMPNAQLPIAFIELGIHSSYWAV